MKIWPGRPYPLGAHYDGAGTNFSIFSSVADRVELCFFDDDGEETRIRLPEVTAHCWHGYPPNIGPGQRYGFRVHGPYDPGQGHRSNPNKMVLDPYAKAIEGGVVWDDAVFPYQLGHPAEDLRRNNDDSAPFMPKSVVINPYFDWEIDRPPAIPWHETVIYETHVKGFTYSHPDIAPEMRGTYAALSTPEAVSHLTQLGVTSVELLPVHQLVHDRHLLDQDLANYWGYNSIGYFAPHNEYSSTGQLGPAGSGVQADGEDAARRRHRGDPRRRLQPHRRGQPFRADARLPGHRQRRLLPAHRRSPLLHGLHGDR